MDAESLTEAERQALADRSRQESRRAPHTSRFDFTALEDAEDELWRAAAEQSLDPGIAIPGDDLAANITAAHQRLKRAASTH